VDAGKFDELMRHWARTKPNEIAFADEEYEITFAQLDSLTHRMAKVLQEEGITRGHLVNTTLPSYLGIITTFALHFLGTVSFASGKLIRSNPPLNIDWNIALLPNELVALNRTIIIDEPFLERVKSTPELESIPGYAKLSDPARLFATSGTTGTLKYTMATAGQLESIAAEVGAFDCAGEPEVMGLFPLSARTTYRHAINSLVSGRSFFSSGFVDYRLPKVLSKYPIRTLMGSPAQIATFLQLLTNTGTNVPFLKTIILAGSHPSQVLIERIHSHLDCTVIDIYGSTEAGLITSREINRDKISEFKMDPLVTLQIVDEKNEVVGPKVVGEVRYRKLGMADSYYANPGATTQFFREGFFYPGDYGYLNSASALVLEGRLDEVFNLGGVKIRAEAVEEIAQAQLGVIDCAAFAMLDPSGIEILGLALVTDDDFDLERFGKVLGKKAPVVPQALFKISSIPRNENGKVLRQALKEGVKVPLKSPLTGLPFRGNRA